MGNTLSPLPFLFVFFFFLIADLISRSDGGFGKCPQDIDELHHELACGAAGRRPHADGWFALKAITDF